jgi:broad-specificity NMP kinase
MPPPLIVELLGLPGSGKSTVSDRARELEPGIAPTPELGWAVLARNVIRVVATLARRRALGRDWTRNLIVMTAYAQALPEALRHRPPAATIVFDQGPLFTLTRPALLDPRLAAWRESLLAEWARLMDLVVFLDAPDEVLAARINSRPTAHRFKGREALEVGPALGDARRDFENAMDSLLAVRGGPAVVRVDTGDATPPEVADEVIALIARASKEG